MEEVTRALQVFMYRMWCRPAEVCSAWYKLLGFPGLCKKCASEAICPTDARHPLTAHKGQSATMLCLAVHMHPSPLPGKKTSTPRHSKVQMTLGLLSHTGDTHTREKWTLEDLKNKCALLSHPFPIGVLCRFLRAGPGCTPPSSWGGSLLILFQCVPRALGPARQGCTCSDHWGKIQPSKLMLWSVFSKSFSLKVKSSDLKFPSLLWAFHCAQVTWMITNSPVRFGQNGCGIIELWGIRTSFWIKWDTKNN